MTINKNIATGTHKRVTCINALYHVIVMILYHVLVMILYHVIVMFDHTRLPDIHNNKVR